MAFMTGKTLAGWRQHIRQNSNTVFALLQAHIQSLATDDNAWLTIANDAQLSAQLDALMPIYRNNPEALRSKITLMSQVGRPPQLVRRLPMWQRKMPQRWPV